GAATGATLGSGINQNVSFNAQRVRNRYIDPNPNRAYVMNWNFNVQREVARNTTAFLGYIGSRSVHLSAAGDDVNLVQPSLVPGVGLVFPCIPSALSPGSTCANQQTGTRIDPNWGGGAGIRPVVYNGASSYEAFQARLKRSLDRKSTRLNSSHVAISYAVFCLKKKKTNTYEILNWFSGENERYTRSWYA